MVVHVGCALPSRRRRRAEVPPSRVRRLLRVSEERSGRVINDSQVINGKRVQVQRRRPFAVFIG